MSKPLPNPSPSNKKLDPVQRFHRNYAAVLAEAEVQAEHTSTAGWKEIYAGRMKAQRDRQRQIAESLRYLADQAEAKPLDELGVKDLVAAKKACETLTDEAEAFDRQTVTPIRSTVEACDNVVTEALRTARIAEEAAPLVEVGLEELMRTAVAKVPRPRWDADAGVVTIAPAPLG